MDILRFQILLASNYCLKMPFNLSSSRFTKPSKAVIGSTPLKDSLRMNFYHLLLKNVCLAISFFQW